MNIKNILRFLLKGTIVTSPLIAVFIIYIITDPFKVIWNYDCYYQSGKENYVTLDKDFVSTTMFEKNHEKYHYNSFLFGNSRSMFYQIDEWKKHLPSTASCFHFDASGEVLFPLTKKIEYIDKQKVNIDNALLLLDYILLSKTDAKTGIFSMAPQLDENASKWEFQKEFLTAFFTPKFAKAYIDLKLTGKIKDYMKKDFLLTDDPIDYTVQTNEIKFTQYENDIKNGVYYTPKRLSVFKKRDSTQQFSEPVIAVKQKEMLASINSIFRRHKTNYKIIINPIYDQIKLNPIDLAYIQELFGKENVYDYSGINWITQDYHNFYEATHYRPFIANQIMDSIYKK
jgi:hypothetical protein